MYFKLLIGLSVLGIIHSACIDNHGNENQCKADLCHWCPCTKLCIPQKYGFGCERGCVGFCNDVDECVARGCIYNPVEKKCYDVDVDRTVDYQATCALNTNPADCTKNGCRYCPCSKKCLPPQDGLDCDSGCYQYCNQPDECASRGCIYWYNACSPWDNRPGRFYRYSVNMCSSQTNYINDIVYLPMDYTKIKVNSNYPWSSCYCNERPVSSRDDKELYKCVYESPDVDVSIPVREAGLYEIGMHFAEIYKRVGRKQRMILNGVTVENNLKIDSYGFASPFTITKTFAINCNITEITVLGQTRPIINKLLILNIELISPSNRHAILQGFYLKKLDR